MAYAPFDKDSMLAWIRCRGSVATCQRTLRSRKSTIALPNGARSSGVRLEIRLSSTTTDSSTQTPPAFSKSSLMPSEPVTRLPLRIFAEMGIHPP